MRNRKSLYRCETICSVIIAFLFLTVCSFCSDSLTFDVQAAAESKDEAALEKEAEELTEDSVSTKFSVKIIDDADLFSEKEEKEIKQVLGGFTAYGNALAATTDDNDVGKVQDLAVKYYDQAFGTECGAVFLIDMEDREIFWYSEGDMYDILTVKQAMAVTDNAYRYASEGDYAACVKKAFSEAVTVIEGGRIRNNMKVYGNALLAIFLALFTNYLFLRKTSFIRPEVRGDKEEMITDVMELTVLGSAQISSKVRESVVNTKKTFGGVGYSSYSGRSYSGSSSDYSGSSSGSSSRSSSSGSSSRSSSGSSSRSSSSGSSSGRSSGSSHRGGGAGHRF